MRLFEGTAWDKPPVCDRCGKLEKECRCPPLPLAPEKQPLKLAMEKRAKGKMVTVVRGFTDIELHQQTLLAELKSACGAGGTISEEGIEIQGDHRDRLRKLLVAKGFPVKG